MKIITKYQADDGKIFDSPEECIKYEHILTKVNDFLETIPNPDDYSIVNGGGYIQHDSDIYTKMETLLVKLSNEWLQPEDKFLKFDYYLGRCIEDSNMRTLNKLSYRLMCINKHNHKEYGQPYYAINPEKCDNIRVN